MLKKDNLSHVLEVFFENPLPEGGFQLRELSRATALAPKSVKNYLKILEKESLISKKMHRVHKYPLYYGNRDNEYFKFLKRQDRVRKMVESGFVDYVWDKTLPEVIILFGSCSRGEDIQESDIDMYIQSSEKKLDISKFEKILQRKINILFEKDFQYLSKELKNNILNGIKLKGYLKVFS
jgi:predicted nucleotidyltransferase